LRGRGWWWELSDSAASFRLESHAHATGTAAFTDTAREHPGTCAGRRRHLG